MSFKFVKINTLKYIFSKKIRLDIPCTRPEIRKKYFRKLKLVSLGLCIIIIHVNYLRELDTLFRF